MLLVPTLGPVDQFALTMVLVAGAAILSALLIHGVWPKTDPTPTALIVFICAMFFRTAGGLYDALARGHLTRGSFALRDYALRVVFCLVLWLVLVVLTLRREQWQTVAHSRAVLTQARVALQEAAQAEADAEAEAVHAP